MSEGERENDGVLTCQLSRNFRDYTGKQGCVPVSRKHASNSRRGLNQLIMYHSACSAHTPLARCHCSVRIRTYFHNARKPISWLTGALLTEKRRQAAERTPGSSPMTKCKRKIKKAWFASFDPAYSTYGYCRTGRIGPAASYLRRGCR